MKIKKVRLLSTIVTIILIFSSIMTSISADSITVNKNTNKVPLGNVDYISIDDYIEKYGEEKVIIGFNQAEAKNNFELHMANGNTSVANSYSKATTAVNTKPNYLYESISSGTFLGMKILGISDIPPNDTRITFRLENNSLHHNTVDIEKDSKSNSYNSRNLNLSLTDNVSVYPNYTVHYSLYEPDNYNLAYEENSGSYFYKYSYHYMQDYMISTDVTFNNTQLYKGSQNNTMYVYINANSGSQFIDFGLIANPSDHNRNLGLYPCYNMIGDDGHDFLAGGLPLVLATYSDSSYMTLENKTINMSLAVDNGTVAMYVSVNGTCIYYNTFYMSQMLSGEGKTLTFLQAMSCIESEGKHTSLSSGAYFTNVTFSNTYLYSFAYGARPFTTTGDATFYTFLCKPAALDFSYSNTANTETISIIYNVPN